MPEPYSKDLRTRALAAAADRGDADLAEVARRFSISESVLHLWRRVHREEGRVEAKPHAGGPTPKLSSAEDAWLREAVAEKNDSTLEEYGLRLAEATGTKVSIATLSRRMKRLRLRRKKKLRAQEQLTEKVQAERAAFREHVAGINPDDLVFVDESGIATDLVRLYARAEAGTRAHGTVPNRHHRKLTLLGGLSTAGLVAMMTIEAATNQDVFLAFVREVLVPELRPGQVVVLDNLSPHKAPAVRKAIEAAKCTVLFLPPYSPDLSPIEPCWSKLKTLLRGIGARTLDALEGALVSTMDRISDSDARSWFAHCGYAVTSN